MNVAHSKGTKSEHAKRNGAQLSPVHERMSRARALAIAAIFLVAATLTASPLERPMHAVEQIRGLTFVHDVETIAIDRDRLPAMLQAQMEKGLPYSWSDYVTILHLLHLVDPSVKNVEKQLLDLLDQQVLAFYDPDTHVYYSIKQPPKGMPQVPGMSMDEAVAVHELTHALQDQRFNIGPKDRELRDDTDAGMALHAVIEGEATLVMLAKMTEPMNMTVEQIASNEMMLDAMSNASSAMASNSSDAPPYFVKSLSFPYIAGLKFVAAAYRKGGWKAVDAIYDSPPQSTREVMHPDEYFAGHRTTNAFDDHPPLKLDSHLLAVDHLGEFHWNFLLGGNSARGWKGDRITVAQNAFCNPTVLIETKWESPESAKAFRDAYSAFLAKEKVDARIAARGNEIDVAYGSDHALIERFIAR